MDFSFFLPLFSIFTEVVGQTENRGENVACEMMR
jgi:hypothetical protein